MPDEAILIDLHCHSQASFDSTVDPIALVHRAAQRGLTHLAITDHHSIEGALRARDARIAAVEIIVGEEVRTTLGDVIALFVERAIPDGLSVEETIAAIRDQNGVVGLPHPFDPHRPSVGNRLDDDELAVLAGLVDYVEVENGRVSDGRARQRALRFAVTYDIARVDASDAHTLVELGTLSTALVGSADSSDGLRASLDRQVAEFREAQERGPRALRSMRRVRSSTGAAGRRQPEDQR